MPRVRHTHDRHDTNQYDRASGIWRSERSIACIPANQKPSAGVIRTLWRQNKVGGHMCAECTTPDTLLALGKQSQGDERMLRSNDQFNTTTYGFSDRLRSPDGCHDILLINPNEMAPRGLDEGRVVTDECAVDDEFDRLVHGLKATAFDLPDICIVAYCPETNAIVQLDYHDQLSRTPVYKGVPIRIRPQGAYL